MNYPDFAKYCAALCAWREARGEPLDGMRAVIWVIHNRAQNSKKEWPQIIFARLQFSSMTAPNDPEVTLVPLPGDPQFAQCCDMADKILSGADDQDLTEGATHYFADSIPMPSWALAMHQTFKLGHHTFYREGA